MSDRTESTLVTGLLPGIFGLFVIFSFLSTGYPFGAENPGHYLLARYAWHHPDNFFNLWGRPLFTLISFPFAQFGMTGMKLMNSLLSVLTGYGAYLALKKLEIRPSWVAVLFVCFTPIWLYVTISALTEVLFGFMLVLSILLILRKRYVFSAIVLSFLMFARLEGFILLPLFGLVFLLRRKYLAIPFLLTGFVCYSLAGLLLTHDLLWIIHRFPYMASSETYAGVRGSFLHYLVQWDVTLGIPLALFFLAGLAGICSGLFSGIREQREHSLWFSLLVVLPFLVYYLFHTILYWQGWGSSLGSLRLISSIFPLAAMIAVVGFAKVVNLFPFPWFRHLFTIVTVVAVITVGVMTYRYPVSNGPEEALISEATTWIRTNLPAETPVFYTSQDACYQLGINPWDSATGTIIHGKSDFRKIPEGTILLWDSHFGPNELKLPKDSLMFRKDLMLIAAFLPEPPRRTLGGKPLEVLVFQKGPLPGGTHNYTLLDSIIRVSERNFTTLFSYSNSFEPPAGWEFESHLSQEVSHSGSFSYKTDSTVVYGPGIIWKVTALPIDTGQLFIRAAMFVWPVESFKENPTSLVISFERDQRPYQYKDLRFELPDYMEPGRWHRVTSRLKVPEGISSEDMFKVYIWHRGKGTLYCDDLQVELLKRDMK